VSTFLSLLRKSAARNITTIDCAILSRYRLRRGTDDGMETSSHDSSPTGEKKPIFKKVKIKSDAIEKSLKNQLLLRVVASYLATVLML
jgi:hypothetical protein